MAERSVRPWLAARMEEYLGEPEETLVGFVMQKLAERSAARVIREELAMVLENDAVKLVADLWRFIVAELGA